MTPDVCREIVAFVRSQRAGDGHFEVAVTAWRRDLSPEAEASQVADFAAAGATWYQVSFAGSAGADEVHEAIRRGPPAQPPV
jgi:hypothetical protein